MDNSISIYRKIWHGLKSALLFPFFLTVAYFNGVPGLLFRIKCMQMGFRVLFKGASLKLVYNLLVAPMDSVRYFEFNFMSNAFKDIKIDKYLDVSSPRLFPLISLDNNKSLFADLINPDKSDLPLTVALAKSFSVDDRCRFYPNLIEDAALEASSYDVVTSISVVEHIPDDQSAIKKMWDLVRPGGKLLISVPCAVEASEEYINLNQYELIAPDENGFVFWQRYYDEELIRQRIFSITGEPSFYEIYAEKKSGNYDKNVIEKRTNPFYPYWREPYMMGVEYEYKKSIADMPGIGVIAMEFIKPH